MQKGCYRLSSIVATAASAAIGATAAATAPGPSGAGVIVTQTASDAALVFVGFLLAAAWDSWRDRRAWRGQKQTLLIELESNLSALQSRFDQLPAGVREGIEKFWQDGSATLDQAILEGLPDVSLLVDLKTSAWQSLVAQGLLPRLGDARAAVSKAYDQIVLANHLLGTSFPLYGLSLNTAASAAQKANFLKAAKLTMAYPSCYTLPAVRAALDALK